ncbi:isopenicillin-N N-acyltransferase-like protein [Saccharopolyspora erythraea NRRL 2338]|uniref:Peptidase C45, acyl-coenzyme A/6-aminopenicillanic acid acyl-transferase n=2 Tax=Saccharopolyspora erythraea TaxID=1836 RepID=A4FKI9_SACEN|nr:C45 family peptidase [Saccharopolyspora erythraea]EQD82259.1 peptidase C45 [Saccharopolyspora erythraea D]PFG98202.1 isopenicillin-N N-acyltransferase-like protein [Saccharopolyspora erythraea NRRL 2338]QRK88302.1 peptidase C45 [Saccharopolyspora erythraea]CAM04564.1 peptidase C45, acyl-coenzyme A/6-aminopenicillanic acid acyl-transferase [Saccharopolyspora erythraea NRRL 2338]
MSLPVHRSDELDPAQRGRGFGRAWRKQVQRSYAGYAELFAAVGASDVRGWSEQAHAETAAWAPALAEEIADVAEGCGLPTWQVAALNARTEILAAAASNGEGECSTSVVLPGAGVAPRTVQTWDWHDTLADGMVIWSLEPRAGHRVHTFTEFGVLGKIGVNSAGLGVHFNVLRHVRDSADIGVPVHVVARRILDEASTVGEAVAIAGSARLSASSLITVATFDGERGEVRGLELSPAGVAGLEPDGTGTFLHTNHFLDVELSAGERTTEAESSTYQRHALLRQRTHALSADDPTARARALHAHHADGAPVCAHADQALPAHRRGQTLATLTLDLAAARLGVHEGGPCGVSAESWQWTA